MMAAILDSLRDSNNSIPLDVSDSLEAIGNDRRRRVLKRVDDTDALVSAGDLADEIAASENNIEQSELSSQQRKRVYISLIQFHLKRLQELDAVVYHRDRKTVEQTDATAELVELIRHVEKVCISTE